jgi:catechol 2,3-dioxygenase-like lactoylglutathione lyase family enzyme
LFERVTIRASDPGASEHFYQTVLPILGFQQRDSRWADFEIAPADDAHPATRGLHIGFVAQSRALVDEFWRVGTSAGHRDDGEPGPRPEYGDEYYGGFLLDPDGNSAEAVHNDSLREGGAVDHLWIRVADVAASKRFYESVGASAGFWLQADMPQRAQFMGDSGSFSVVLGEPTRNVELVFRARGGGRGERVDPDGNRIELVVGS